jgi:HEPN superfamily RiboL-PSP-like protein
MASARFLTLRRRILRLEKRFIPKKPAPLGNYSERQLDLVRAYRLLAHAEIEAYIEDQARDVVMKTVQAFKNDGKPRMVVLTLISFHGGAGASATAIKKIYSGNTSFLHDKVDAARTAQMRLIAKNNGIKETDVLQLLMPLGFEKADVDATLLATMDSFGANRGKVAHSSSKAQQQIDPFTEQKTVGDILNDLEQVGKKFSILLKQC